MKSPWSTPLYSWMIKQFKDELPTTKVREKLKKKAREAFLRQVHVLLDRSRQESPPFDPFAVAKLRKIHTITWVNSREEASLVPDTKGFHLILRIPKDKGSLTPEELKRDFRIRSTVAHEVGHTYFFDISTLPPKLGPTLDRLSTSFARKKEEYWCFDFARQLLLPNNHLRKFLERYRKTSGLELALLVRKKFHVSWDILMRKMVYDMGIWRNYTILRLIFKDSRVILQNKFRDLWKGANSRIRNAEVWVSESESFLLDCLRKFDTVKCAVGSEVRKFSNLQERYTVEILPIYDKFSIFLCLVRESDGVLEEFLEIPSRDHLEKGRSVEITVKE